MVLFIPGMRCVISSRPIESANELVAFPPFVANDADPLHVFSDAVIHTGVFQRHPLAAQAQARLEEALRRTAFGSRQCSICGQLVADHNSYLGLGHLVEDRTHPLHRFNYAHFHRSCLAPWPELPGLIAELDKFDKSGAWKGNGLKHLMSDLRSVAA